MSKTFDLVLSIWHQDDGEMGAQRLCYNTKEDRDTALENLLGQAMAWGDSQSDAYYTKPDATGSGIILERADLSSIHYRTEDPPKPPVAVAFEGKDYVPVEDVSGAKVLWPAAWFGAKRKDELPAAAVN